MKKPRSAPPELRLVASSGAVRTRVSSASDETVPREIDWSILMARAQAGEQQAYRRLLEEVAPYLRSLAASSHRDPRDVEDVVQEVLLSVHAIRHTYDPARPFGPWLVAIANRRIIDRLRRQGRRREHEVPLEPEHETIASNDDGSSGGAAADAATLRAAVDSLPTAQRDAILLMKLQEMSLRQAAAATGMSIGALKVAAHRGLKNLGKLLATGRSSS